MCICIYVCINNVLYKRMNVCINNAKMCKKHVINTLAARTHSLLNFIIFFFCNL